MKNFSNSTPTKWENPRWPTEILGPEENYASKAHQRWEKEVYDVFSSYGLSHTDILNTIASTHYKMIDLRSLAKSPPLQWVVKGALPRNGIAAIYGPSGCGKSFLVLDMAHAIANGRRWFGLRTTACPIVYVCLEGQSGLSQRVRAINLQSLNDVRIYVITQPCSFANSVDIHDLIEVIKLHKAINGIVIIDTLNGAMPGSDENSSADMGKIIAMSKQLQTAIGGLILLVHHTGKDSSRGMRGHSSLFAAMDAAIEVKRNGEQREWSLAKSKDGADSGSHAFKLKPVVLGFDEDGDVMDSCVVDPCEAVALDVKQQPIGRNQQIVADGLMELLKASPHAGQGGSPIDAPCIQLDATINQLRGRLTDVPPTRRKERIKEAIEGLLSKGTFQKGNGWIWPT